MNGRILLPALGLLSLAIGACAVGAPEGVDESTAAVEQADERANTNAGICTSGYAGFEQEFLPNAQAAVCKACHKGSNPNAPPWLAGTNEQIYTNAKNYVNFADLDNSRLVIRAGNLHCGGGCNEAMRVKMKTWLEKWWVGGENTCDQSFTLRTGPQRVPADLPSDRYVTMEWDLAPLDVALRGVKMTIEIRKFTNAEGPVPGSYIIRKPRFVSTRLVPIAIERVRVLNNGSFQEAANQLERIHGIVTPDVTTHSTMSYPVLSPEQTFIVEERPGADDLTIAFDKLAKSDGRACRAMDKFNEKVMPIVEARSCVGCHAPGATASTMAVSRFDMSGTNDELCAKFFGRTWTNPDVLPALIQFPLYGRFEHPKVFVGAKDVLPAWTEWMDAEWR